MTMKQTFIRSLRISEYNITVLYGRVQRHINTNNVLQTMQQDVSRLQHEMLVTNCKTNMLRLALERSSSQAGAASSLNTSSSQAAVAASLRLEIVGNEGDVSDDSLDEWTAMLEELVVASVMKTYMGTLNEIIETILRTI